MKFARIAFVISLFFCLISCQNGINKKSNLEPEKNTIPTTDFKKIEKSTPELNQKKTIRQHPEKEVEDKKSKAIDTLMPVRAIP